MYSDGLGGAGGWSKIEVKAKAGARDELDNVFHTTWLIL